MAQQNNEINIRVKFLGASETITTMDQLNEKLETYRKKLEQLKQDVSSGKSGAAEEFQQLSEEIGNAQGKLEQFQEEQKKGAKDTKDIVETNIGSYLRLGTALTAGFAAARQAFALFGAEGEELNKAAIKAQTLLTITLAASAVAQEAATLKKIKDTVVTIANTAAQQGLIASLRVLWATMLANPLTSVLALLGAVVSTMIIFSDSTEEAAEQQKTLTESLQESAQATVMETEKLEILNDIVNDTNISMDARLGAYEQLKKILPELANYTLQEAQSMGILNKAYEREIELIKLRAKAKGLEDFIAQQEKERIAALVAQEQAAATAEAIIELSRLQQEYARASAGGFMGSFEEFEQQEKNRLLLFQGGNNVLQRRTAVEQELYDITAEISKLEQQRNNDIKTGQGRIDGLKKSEEELKKQRQALVDLLIQQLKLEEQLYTQRFELKELNNELLKTTEDNITKADGYANSLNRLKSISILLQEASSVLITQEDKLGGVFKTVKTEGEDFIDSLDSGLYTIEQFKEKIKSLEEGLSQEQVSLLKDFSQNYIEIYETFTALKDFKGGVLPEEIGLGNFQQVVTDLNLALGKIVDDPYKRSAEEVSAAKATAKTRYEIYKQSFLDEYQLYLEDQLRKEGLTEEEIKSRKGAITAIAEETFASLSGIGDELLKFEQGVGKTAERIVELNKRLQELGPAARRGLIIENAQAIADEYAGVLSGISKTDEELSSLREKLRRKDYSEEAKYNDALIGLKESLKARGIDIAELEYSELLVLLEAFLAKEVELTQTAEGKKQKAREETINNILANIQEFRSALTSISQTVADFYSAQLSNLDRENEYITDKIVGDTEEANQKRLEQEKIYQTKKKELEKKATLTSLRFSQVQAAANVAEAITKALTAGPIAGQIAAAITAAAGLVQIGIIQSQISSAQSYQRGGIIKGMGGLLVGPSHEYGGIRYGQRGLELEGGEAVINRNSRLRYSELLNQININGGGRPLVQNNFDDSRIVEAIAKQRQEPIRAYVVESDITNKQAVSKRLERLSQF